MSLVPSALVSGPNVNKLDPSSFKTTGSGSALQAPQRRTTRTVRVEINSMDRNYSKYPYSTNFHWVFPFPVKEIREVRLIGGTIPVPYLNIDTQWNKFTFKEGTTQYTITIPVGFYTVATLMITLQGLLNSSGTTNDYEVTQSLTGGQLIFTAVKGILPFALLFASGNFTDVMDKVSKSILELKSPARILGFGYADYSSSAGTITAARLPNLWYALERSYLYLNFDSSQDLRSVFRGSGRKEPSAIFYNDELNIYNYPGGLPTTTPYPLTKYLNKETYDTVILPSPAPISRISFLEVSLRDGFYNLLNTQGRELSILLELSIVD
jgi:hypothetical protein